MFRWTSLKPAGGKRPSTPESKWNKCWAQKWIRSAYWRKYKTEFEDKGTYAGKVSTGESLDAIWK